MRDLYSNIQTATAIGPATHSATVTGAAIDLISANRACVCVTTGSVNGAGDFGLTLQESDTDQPGDFSDVAASHMDSNAPATLEADSVYRIGYRGHKRYIRLVATKAGGTSLQMAALTVLGDLSDVPAA